MVAVAADAELTVTASSPTFDCAARCNGARMTVAKSEGCHLTSIEPHDVCRQCRWTADTPEIAPAHEAAPHNTGTREVEPCTCQRDDLTIAENGLAGAELIRD